MESLSLLNAAIAAGAVLALACAGAVVVILALRSPHLDPGYVERMAAAQVAAYTAGVDYGLRAKVQELSVRLGAEPARRDEPPPPVREDPPVRLSNVR